MHRIMQNPIVQFLLERNAAASALFNDDREQREEYRRQHPTEIAALKCMDGRLNLAVMTETPTGIIQPFRNIGGLFDLGWPYFGSIFEKWVNYCLAKGRPCLAFVTYHFSKGDTHRGCAGHAYNTPNAIACAVRQHAQIWEYADRRFTAAARNNLYPIVVGIETDEDALVLQGMNGQSLDLSTMSASTTEEEMLKEIVKLYPDMSRLMGRDLLPLLMGNLRHIAKIRAMQRPITDAEHKEQVLVIGRGVDWLHLPNKALIVGPYSYNLGGPIGTAGKLLLANLREGRIPADQGVVLMSSAVYRGDDEGERARAPEKAISMAKFAYATLKEQVPELIEHLHCLVGTSNADTRLLTPMLFDPNS